MESMQDKKRTRHTYANKKAHYQPSESEILSKIGDIGSFRVRSYHLLYNEEDPGTNHLIANVDFSSVIKRRVEAVFRSREDDYDEVFFGELEDILSRISTYFQPFLTERGGIEEFSLTIKGTPIRLRLMDEIKDTPVPENDSSS